MCLFKKDYREKSVKSSISRKGGGKKKKRERSQSGPTGNAKDNKTSKGKDRLFDFFIFCLEL